MKIRRYNREYIKIRKINDGVVRMVDTNRYCSIEESIRESLKQMQLMKNGVIAKKSWKDFCSEMESEEE